MQPEPQTRRSPHRAGSGNRKRLGGRIDSTTANIPVASIPTLLRHHAGFVDCILVMICSGQTVSIAGRKALRYTVDRLNRIAEALQ